MARYTKEQTERWLEREFITCQCGYRNQIHRFQKYGVCLCCGKILDDRVYFKARYYQKKRKMRNKK